MIELMTHIVIGYPSLQETISIAKAMAKSGVDRIELQIPFSDPIADGPTIMKACEQSLQNGTRVEDAFKIAEQLSHEVTIPLLFMAYYNTVFKYGTERFCKHAHAVGIRGLIVPDMPIDEEREEHFITSCQKYSLNNIQVISPTSTDERLKKNAMVARDFVYFTAQQGVTGAKDALNPQLIAQLQKVREFFSLPIAVGFGISKKEHIRKLTPYADIAVVGSALIDIINTSNKEDREKNIEQFIKKLYQS